MLWRLKRFIRQRTQPIDKARATAAKEKLALVYALLAWNVMGLSVYYYMSENAPKTHDVIDYAKLLGVKNAHIIKFEGFKKTEDYKVTFTDAEIEEYHNKSKSSGVSENKVESTTEELNVETQ